MWLLGIQAQDVIDKHIAELTLSPAHILGISDILILAFF